MNSENSLAELSESTTPEVDQSATGKVLPLRIWPAVLLVLMIWCLRYCGVFVEEPSVPLMMTQFMGPGAIALLVLVWWVFFSRALLWEKLVGAIALMLIAVMCTMFAHKTVQGMGTMIYGIPWGMTAFCLGAIFFRSYSPARLVVALLAATVGFGYWSLVRTDSITGDFQTVQRWRWQPTPEDSFLETLTTRTPDSELTTSDLDMELIAEPEWPEFRGPNRDGVLPGLSIEENWKQHPPKEIWRNKIGPGWSSFAVAGNRLFTQEQRGDNEAVVCYNAKNGNEAWVHQDESRFWETIGGAGPRGTPTIANGKLFALGANGILSRLDPQTGEVVWQRKLREDAGREPPMWGFSSSPLVIQGLVIVHAGGEGNKGVFAYDEETGELRWSTPSGDHSYSSPQLSVVDGKKCILMLTNAGLEFIEPDDGASIGEYPWPYEGGYRVIQPLVLNDSRILLGTPMGPGTKCISATWDGSKFATEEVWATKRMNPYFNDFIEHEGFLYGFNNAIFACIDVSDGTRKWKGGRYGHGQLLFLPDSKQLLVITEDGDLVLVSATPDKHTELAKFKVFDARTWNHPVIVGNRLYVRNAQECACFELTTISDSDDAS